VYQEAESHLGNVQKEYEAVEAETRQTVNRMDATETDLDAARRRVDQLNRSIEEVNSEIEAAQIVSPVDGIVTGMAARQGEVIHPEMDTLMQIATDLSRMQVILEPSPAQMAAMYPGQSVRVFVAELPGEALEGTITEMTIGRTIVEFLNPSPRVRPGLTAQVLVSRSR
jgi:multidrug resistance efflux pump